MLRLTLGKTAMDRLANQFNDFLYLDPYSVEQGSIFLFPKYLTSKLEDPSRRAAFRDPADADYFAYPYAPRVHCHAFQDAVCTTNPMFPL